MVEEGCYSRVEPAYLRVLHSEFRLVHKDGYCWSVKMADVDVVWDSYLLIM